MRKPTDGVVTFPYGATSPPYSPSNPHAGVDYGAKLGDNIYAPHAGKITLASNLGDCGLGVDIDGGRFKSRLCHNSKILVKVGQQVSEGQVIAKAGATGLAQGVHAHWVMWKNGKRVDGEKYLKEDEMYKGKTAKEWYDLYVKVAGQAKRVTKIADKRGRVLGLIKKVLGVK